MYALLQLSESKQQLQISAKRLNAAEQLLPHKESCVQASEQYATYLEHKLSQLHGAHDRLKTQYNADMFDMEQQVSDLQVLDANLSGTYDNAVLMINLGKPSCLSTLWFVNKLFSLEISPHCYTLGAC